MINPAGLLLLLVVAAFVVPILISARRAAGRSDREHTADEDPLDRFIRTGATSPPSTSRRHLRVDPRAYVVRRRRTRGQVAMSGKRRLPEPRPDAESS